MRGLPEQDALGSEEVGAMPWYSGSRQIPFLAKLSFMLEEIADEHDFDTSLWVHQELGAATLTPEEAEIMSEASRLVTDAMLGRARRWFNYAKHDQFAEDYGPPYG